MQGFSPLFIERFSGMMPHSLHVSGLGDGLGWLRVWIFHLPFPSTFSQASGLRGGLELGFPAKFHHGFGPIARKTKSCHVEIEMLPRASADPENPLSGPFLHQGPAETWINWPNERMDKRWIQS